MPAVRRIILPLLIGGLLAACASEAPATPTAAVETSTAAATVTPRPTASPTHAVGLAPVDATVAVGTVSCRVGPGGGYLLRTVLREGEAVQILGQMELNSNWVLIATAEFPAGCWVNTSVLSFDDAPLNTITDPHRVLPVTTYYSPLRNVRATRTGDVVRVRWDPMILRDGDDSLQTPYVVEAWVCQNGEFVFRTFGTEEYGIQIRDEDGCEQESRGQVAGAEKSGYTMWVSIPWP